MAYATKYVFTFQSVGGTTREIRILKDGYSGDPIRRALGRAPILKKQQNGPVHGTSLEIYAECYVDQEFIEFYTSDPKAYRVELYAGSTLLWQGWISPELYSEPDIAPPYDVQVVATDGVGELKLYDFAAQGTVSLRAMLTYLLGKTGLSTDVFLVSSLKAGSAGAGALLDMEANFDYLVGKTCYEALSYLLTTLHATITWWGGHWLLVRENNVTFTSGKVRYFNVAGNSALLANSVQALGRMYQDAVWPVGQLSTVIDPAKNKVVVQAPWHPVTALQNSDMTADANWNKSGVTYDSAKGAYFFARDVITPGELAQSVAFGGLRVPMRMTLSGCGTSETGSGFTGTGNGWVGLVLKFQDGDGNVYYLGVDGDGNRRWELYDSGRIPRAFEQDLLSVDTDRENADRIELDIPALAVDGGFPSGTLTVGIWGGAVYVFSAHLDVVLNKGYQDILHIDNGARGEGDDTEIAFGRVTSDVAYYQAFVQGILLNNGALITAFSDANFTTGTDYLSFISRDYARSVALPRARVEGTVSLEPSVQLPPLVFTKGGLDYWLETWSWNLYEDELQISARTLPTATLTVDSETITEAGGASSSGASSGGATQVPSSGVNYFEPGTASGLIQLKSLYNYLGPRKGLIFGRNSSADGNVDLEVVNIASQGETPRYALHSPLPFFSDDFVSGNGLSSGGGAAGIDPAAMWAYLKNTSSDHTYDTDLIAAAHIPDVASVYGYLKQADIDPILALIPAQASSSNQLADKTFVNSSIATATATYRGNYNEYTDLGLTPSATHAQIATALASEISGADANDYCFVEIPTSTSDPTQIERTERYKYSGSAWEYEYTLNNSGFTAVQWAAINSNITSGKVSAYDTLAGYFSNGVLGTSHLPALYLGTTQIQTSSAQQDVTGIGNLTMGFNKKLNMQDDAASPNSINALQFYKTTGSSITYILRLGGGMTAADRRTMINGGAEVRIQTGRSTSTTHITFQENGDGVKSTRLNSYLVLPNAAPLYMYDNPTDGTNSSAREVLYLSNTNYLRLGYETATKGYATRIHGSLINFYTAAAGSSQTVRMQITAAGDIETYGDIKPHTPEAYDLGSSSAYFAETYTKKIYLASGTYFELDSDGYVHLVTPSGKGFYCDGFVSGNGLSSGGGASGIDALAMWKLLTNDQTLSSYDDNTKIAGAHIPDMATTYSYVKTADIADMATKTWVGSQNYYNSSNLSLATLAGNSAIGNATTPVYYNGSALTAASAYAGGTKVTLNGADKGATTASFYAPASAGTAGQILKAASGGPAWTSAALGASNKPIYLNSSGVLTEGVACVDLTGEQTISGTKTFSAAPILNNGISIRSKDSGGVARSLLELTSGDRFVLGYGPSGAGYPTYLYGNEVYIGTGASRTTRMTVAADGAVSMTGSLSVAGRASAAGLDLPNNTPIQIYDNPGAGGTATLRGVLELTVKNIFVLGWSVGSAGYTTQLHGNNVNFYYGTAHTLGMSLTSAGKVNIASPSSAAATVNVNGTIWASTGIWTDGFLSGGGISSSSDRRLKDGIKDFAYSSALLMALRPREWDWNDRTPLDGHSAGFVAQEVEPLLPYAVKERTYKTLTYDIFDALEVSALQDHENHIQDHETRIRALENENKELKKRLEKYELGRN